VTREADRWTVRVPLDSADSTLVALAKDAHGNASALQSGLR
jgi:hypothetical protein